jgi:hypothetical protein
MSSFFAPDTQSTSSCSRFSPSSMPSDGCQRMLIPKSVTKSRALGSSALRNDIVLPEHAPPCNHNKLANLLSSRDGRFFRLEVGVESPSRATPRGDHLAPRSLDDALAPRATTPPYTFAYTLAWAHEACSFRRYTSALSLSIGGETSARSLGKRDCPYAPRCMTQRFVIRDSRNSIRFFASNPSRLALVFMRAHERGELIESTRGAAMLRSASRAHRA